MAATTTPPDGNEDISAVSTDDLLMCLRDDRDKCAHSCSDEEHGRLDDEIALIESELQRRGVSLPLEPEDDE